MSEPTQAEDAGEPRPPTENAEPSSAKPSPAPKVEAQAPAWTEIGPITPIAALPAYGLAFLTGFLYFIAFPGIDVWPLSLVALVPLIIALRGQTARRATGLGWMAGFTMTMFGFYWLLEMLKVFSGFPTPLCILFMAILCAYQAGRIALCGFLYGRAERRGWPAPIVFGLAFVASELVYPLLFPWYYGATVHNFPILMQVADIGGPYLIAIVLIAPNLAIAEVFLARREHRAYDRRVGIAAAAILGVALLYGKVRMASVDARAGSAQSIRIGIIQGNQPLIGKHDALRVHMKRTLELKERGAELVVWSEGASGTAYRESPPHEEEARRQLTSRLGVPSMVGTLLVRPPDPKDPKNARATFFNSALLTDKDGNILGRYDKQFLLAFGEYIPFGDTFPVLYQWSPNSSRFSPGTSVEPLPMGEHKITALICYEDILPTFVNKAVKAGDPDLLVNMTNDTWFGDTTEPYIHFALAKLRAVEHRRYLIRSTNSGLSGIIDAAGRVTLHGGTYAQEALLGEAKFMRSTTGYEVLGDYPWWLATAAIAFMALRSRYQKGVPRKA